MNKIKVFWYGFLAGMLFAGILFGVGYGIVLIHNRNKELSNYALEYAEKQNEIEVLREDYIHRDPVEFLEIPGVRGAADGAAAEFDRKRDEVLQRFRGGLAR